MKSKITDEERKATRKARNARYQARLKNRIMAAKMFAALEEDKG